MDFTKLTFKVINHILRYLMPISFMLFLVYFVMIVIAVITKWDLPNEISYLIIPAAVTGLLMIIVIIDRTIKEVKQKLKELKELEDEHQEEA